MLPQLPGVVASFDVTVGVPHASVAVAALKVGVAGQVTDRGPPTLLITGGV